MKDGRNAFEKFHRLVDGHIQHIADVFTLVPYFERFAVIAAAVACIAFHIYVGQKIHFNGLQVLLPGRLRTGRPAR